MSTAEVPNIVLRIDISEIDFSIKDSKYLEGCLNHLLGFQWEDALKIASNARMRKYHLVSYIYKRVQQRLYMYQLRPFNYCCFTLMDGHDLLVVLV